MLGFVKQPRIMKYVERLAKKHMRDGLGDRTDLIDKVTPDYTIGCKRILPSNKWYPAIAKDNVELVNGGVERVTPRGVVGTDGVEREVDAIIFGTGFEVTDIPAARFITGRGGLGLDDVWHGSPNALNGATIPGFPNLFMLLGPNTGLGHSSMVYMIESQIAYVMSALDAMDARGAATVEVRAEAVKTYNERIDRQLDGTVWNTGCASLVHGRHGPQRDAVARLDVRVPAPAGALRRRVLHARAGAPARGGDGVKRVIITGAASGIGAATATALRVEGLRGGRARPATRATTCSPATCATRPRSTRRSPPRSSGSAASTC